MNPEQQAYIFFPFYIDVLLLWFQDGVQQGVCSTIQAEKTGTIIWTRVTGNETTWPSKDFQLNM
jgi:hypothetical protein